MTIKENCVLWSGGKDCFLAFVLSLLRPESTLFVTFVPPVGIFRCHPLGLLLRQGQGLGVGHEFIVIDSQDWKASYKKAFAFLRETYGVARVITGDIVWSSRQLSDYWLQSLLSSLGIELHLPLMGLYAETILELQAAQRIIAPITAMRQEYFRPGLLGQAIIDPAKRS